MLDSNPGKPGYPQCRLCGQAHCDWGPVSRCKPPRPRAVTNLWLLVLDCTELAAVSPPQLAQYTGKLADACETRYAMAR